MKLLFFAGIGVILAGLLTIGFGIPVKEFGFGNTLILTGTIGACTGLIMISLAVVIRELNGLGERLAPLVQAPSRLRQELPLLEEAEERHPAPGEPTAADASALFSRDQPAMARAGAAGAATPPWQQEAQRERSRDTTPVAEAAEPAAAEPKQRRNLLFSSSRRERERAEAEQASGTAVDHPAASPPAAADAPRATFEDAWPPVERERPEPPRRSPRPSVSAREESAGAATADRAFPPRPDAAAEVTVLKSGVVDGMAYSLYSDGSIEAQMPEGMMRFASIDELREHLDQRA